MRSRLPEGSILFAVLLGALLVIGLLSLRLIPVYVPLWGLDFQNVYAYQTCPEAQESSPYSVSGQTCGDEKGRAFLYPPALFQSFSWVVWFNLDRATLIWNAIFVILMLLSGMVWWRLDKRHHSGWRSVALVVFWLFLMVQFPSAFALERGNNDVIPLALWSGAAALFVRRRAALSGSFAGLATALKVYPIVAAALIVIGLLSAHTKTLGLFIVGAIAGASLASAFWWTDTVHYFTKVLPAFAVSDAKLFVYNHPLAGLGVHTVFAVAIGLTLFGSWAFAAWKGLPQEPLLVFSGALAISTYYSTTSWDYNLITTYPLLLLVTARALTPGSPARWKVASFGAVLALVVGRGMFSPAGQLYAQIGVLVGIAWLVILLDPAPTAGANASPINAAT